MSPYVPLCNLRVAGTCDRRGWLQLPSQASSSAACAQKKRGSCTRPPLPPCHHPRTHRLSSSSSIVRSRFAADSALASRIFSTRFVRVGTVTVFSLLLSASRRMRMRYCGHATHDSAVLDLAIKRHARARRAARAPA